MIVSQMETGMIWMMTLGKNTKMKKLIKLIKEFIFGRRADAVCQIKLGFKTTYPPNQPDEWAWKQEFKVGMLCGKKAIYLN
jgi:hypothetical protein